MKTWTLVWFLVFPPNDAGMARWEMHSQPDMTYSACVKLLAQKDAEYREDAELGEIMGHTIHCEGPEDVEEDS